MAAKGPVLTGDIPNDPHPVSHFSLINGAQQVRVITDSGPEYLVLQASGRAPGHYNGQTLNYTQLLEFARQFGTQQIEYHYEYNVGAANRLPVPWTGK